MRKLLGVVLITVLVAAIAAPALASTSAAKKPPVKDVKVDVDQYLYSPKKMTIKKGTKVVWKWVDGNDVAHNVKVRKGPVKFHSAEFKTSGTFSHIFNVKGTYHLFCTLHTFMVETVVVK